jgi:hypothetical protein
MTDLAEHPCTTLRQLGPLYVRFEQPDIDRQSAVIRFGIEQFANTQITAARTELYDALRDYAFPAPGNASDRERIPDVEPFFEWSKPLGMHMLAMRVTQSGRMSRGFERKLITVVGPRYYRGGATVLEITISKPADVNVTATGDDAFELYDAFKALRGTTVDGIEVDKVTFSPGTEQFAQLRAHYTDGTAPEKLVIWRQLCELGNIYLDV